VVAVPVVRSSCDDNTICYVIPFLWMMSRFHVMGHTARAWHWKYRRRLRAHKFSTYSSGGATLFNFVIVYSDSKLRTWAKSAIYNYCLLRLLPVYLISSFILLNSCQTQLCTSELTPFKVIQGHRFWYQSKAHIDFLLVVNITYFLSCTVSESLR